MDGKDSFINKKKKKKQNCKKSSIKNNFISIGTNNMLNHYIFPQKNVEKKNADRMSMPLVDGRNTF